MENYTLIEFDTISHSTALTWSIPWVEANACLPGLCDWLNDGDNDDEDGDGLSWRPEDEGLFDADDMLQTQSDNLWSYLWAALKIFAIRNGMKAKLEIDIQLVLSCYSQGDK